jgi:hypothetical protein
LPITLEVGEEMPEIWIDYLNAIDADVLALTNEEILAAVEQALAAQGRGETVIEPRVISSPRVRTKGISTCCAGISERSALPV